MKKRKIFYFLKTKEEYDYMLSGGLIPKRGIVLIESTQEIYRDKKPYSGYGPLKSYFDSLRTDLQSLILNKSQDVSSMVDSINTQLQKDVNDYNEQFGVKLTQLQSQISENAESISDIIYYRDNTLIPSLEQTKNNTEDLSNKYNEVLQQVSKNGSTVNQFKSTLEGLISNIQEFKTTYNNELSSIRNSMLINSNSSGDGTVNEAKIRNIVKESQLTDTEFASKVRITVDPLLTSLREEINKSVNAKLKEVQGGSGTDNSSSIAYVEEMLNKHASSLDYGTVRLGKYLIVDSNGNLTLDKYNLKTDLEIGSGTTQQDQNTSLVTNSTINEINRRLRVLEAVIGVDSIESKIKEIMQSLSTSNVVNINWEDVYSSEGFKTSVKGVLRELNIIDATGNYTTPTSGTSNTLNYQLFEDQNGYVQETFKNNSTHDIRVQMDNVHGITVYKYNNDVEQSKIVIGTSEAASSFGITIYRKDPQNNYVAFNGCDKEVTIGTYKFIFKNGICVSVERTFDDTHPLDPTDDNSLT